MLNYNSCTSFVLVSRTVERLTMKPCRMLNKAIKGLRTSAGYELAQHIRSNGYLFRATLSSCAHVGKLDVCNRSRTPSSVWPTHPSPDYSPRAPPTARPQPGHNQVTTRSHPGHVDNGTTCTLLRVAIVSN